jgi:hypothetical protein
MSANDKTSVHHVKTMGAKAVASQAVKKAPTRVTGKSPKLKK